MEIPWISGSICLVHKTQAPQPTNLFQKSDVCPSPPQACGQEGSGRMWAAAEQHCPPNLHGNEGSHQLGQPKQPWRVSWGLHGPAAGGSSSQVPAELAESHSLVLRDRGKDGKVLGGIRGQEVAGPVLCRHLFAVHTGNFATIDFIQSSF